MQRVCVNLLSQATFKKIFTNDVIADNAALTINGPRMLKWYSSHPSRILICPIMHIKPIHIFCICVVSFIKEKHMTQKHHQDIKIFLKIVHFRVPMYSR